MDNFQETEEDKMLRQAYRDYLSRELRRPEILEEKKLFLAEFFSPNPLPLFAFRSAGFWAPVLALGLVFGIFFQFQERMQPYAGAGAPIQRLFEPVMQAAREREAAQEAARRFLFEQKQTHTISDTVLEDPVKNHMKPRVVVKRLTSQVGPTMVYQRSYRDMPVTVVWVFPIR